MRERFPSATSGTKALNRPCHVLQPTTRKSHTSNRKSVKISPGKITLSRFLRWNYQVNNWLRHFAPRTGIFQSRDRGRISTISKMTEHNDTILLTAGLIQSRRKFTQAVMDTQKWVSKDMLKLPFKSDRVYWVMQHYCENSIHKHKYPC